MMMRNFLKIFGVLLMMTLFTNAYSQAQSKIESYKIGFFTEKLQLTPTESQAFWPLYNQYKDNLQAVKRDNFARPKTLTLLSDEEIEGFFEDYLNGQEEEIELRRNFYKELKTIFSPRKAVMVFFVEREFNQRLLQTMSNRRKND